MLIRGDCEGGGLELEDGEGRDGGVCRELDDGIRGKPPMKHVRIPSVKLTLFFSLSFSSVFGM